MHTAPITSNRREFEECVPLAKLAHDAVDDGDVLVPHVVDHHLTDICLLDQVSVPYQQLAVSPAHLLTFCARYFEGSGNIGVRRTEEEKVAALECRFHGPGQDDDDGRGRVGDDGESVERRVSSWSWSSGESPASYPFHIMKAVDKIRPGSGACQCRGPAGLAAARSYQS